MGYSQLYQLKENTLNNGLIAHYPFNGNANDISGNNYHGTVVGATPTTNRFGITNSAYYCDCVDDYIQLPKLNNLIYGGTFSISLFAKFPGAARILDTRNASSQGLLIKSDMISFQYGISSHTIQYITTEFDKWNHIVLNYNNNIAYIYINGKYISHANIINNWGTIATIYFPIIGKHSHGSIYTIVNIDSLRIFNRVLSTSEIKALYRERPETNYFAEFVQANGYQVATSGNITGWLTNELTGCRVEQLGSATVSINSNSYISYSSGTLFGIKIYDSSDNLIHELACCENNVNVPYLHCSVGGRVFYILNTKTIVKQDIYFKCQENGWQRVTITESGDIIDVAYANDKTKIYE